ncbi:DUF2059 domain-containing protein [Sulfitobacter sp. M57]|uniref:DUF2059 domain-containing protein n=1 Tax=unclassified Sulfitobacter TaxID=196795 RepID=UPI0023E2BA4A|nr:MULTISPECIES: DUF2059 domain-containing protein [unclassified Sulfitobacter]MDF3413728.1 DUF2059 domain-containing protein [Sulfitobacter sp. KE5]MDF3420991.1 DUF2059 domain-containing protein [Sulfitobacter sp. KE43]MDF3432274.1 DUF2059 domain-containing protein [Sulfitobacter sp. KE42]MDF3457913.1 DUF2059 domain-containing protein [Sulfitobacter sp. S74]MDF3461814.1 DUF2059 domain-containing protein [Sulfitobacter sp. Ks18]
MSPFFGAGRAVLVTFALWVFGALAASADARMTALVDVLKLNEAAMILSDEGKVQAQDINLDMLDGQGGAGWAQQVDRIYAPALMVELVRAELERELSGEALEDVIRFYAGSRGTRIVDLENAARRAIQDPEVEAAARARFAEVEDSMDKRLALITRYVEQGDMISRNVTSALNSNYQFLRGLAEGGALEMTEEEMLADAATDIEASTRDTTEWLFGFLLLAYHPLDDDDLQAYITFCETDAGQALNRALFEGFGKAYEDISYALGRAVALNMTAQEL